MNTEIITLAAIMKFFKEDSNTFEKGEKKFQADYVLKLEIQDLDIIAKVLASLKDRSYKIVLTVDGSGDLLVHSVNAHMVTGFVAIWLLQQFTQIKKVYLKLTYLIFG